MSSAHCAVVQEVASVLFASLAALEAVLSWPSLELVARGLPEGGPGGVGGGECCLTCSRPESWLLGGREYSDEGWGLVVGEWVAPPRSLMASLIGGSLNGFSTICSCTI